MQICSRLALIIFIEQKDAAAHRPCRFQDAVPGGIDPYVADEDVRTGDEKPCSDEIGGRGNISRNADFLAGEAGTGGNNGSSAFGTDIRAESPQHQFRMIAA